MRIICQEIHSNILQLQRIFFLRIDIFLSFYHQTNLMLIDWQFIIILRILIVLHNNKFLK